MDGLDETLPAPGGAPKADALAPGTQAAGRYRIVRFLGAGGVGEVYAAEDLIVGNTVALKTLRPELAASGHAIARFRREIALARKVTDRHVCRLHDVGEHAGRVFLTMELLDGRTLAERCRADGPLPFPELDAIAIQLVEGLAALHDAGVVHRDFKSANVILVGSKTGGERAVITDFGLARSTEDRDAMLTAEAGLLGTPAYMAPEQVEGREATPATDIYSLGVVLFELVTGTLPFREDTALATATARLQRDPPSPGSRRAATPGRWNAIILRCLQRDPAKRFASVRDVLRDLPRPRSRRWFLAAGATAATAGLGVSWSWLSGGDPVVAAPRHELVAVLPFTGVNGAWSLALSTDLYDALASSGLPMLAREIGGMVEIAGGTTAELMKESDPAAAAWAVTGVTAVVRTSAIVPSNGTTPLKIELAVDRGDATTTHVFERSPAEVGLLVEDAAQYLALMFGRRPSRGPRDVRVVDSTLCARYGAALERLYAVDGKPLESLEALLADQPALHRAAARLAHRLVDTGQHQDSKTRVMSLIDRAVELTDRVLAMDPDHPMALAARGSAARVQYDWPTAERLLVRARAAAPSHARISFHLSFIYMLQGKFDESRSLREEARVRNPRSPNTLLGGAWNHYYSRRYSELISYVRAIRDRLGPEQRIQLATWEALAYIELARFKDALEAAKPLEQTDELYWKASLAQIYAAAGRRDEAVALQTAVTADQDFSNSAAGWAKGAMMDDALGNIDAALTQLERLVESHNVHAGWLKIEPFSVRLRSDPRFQVLLNRVGLG